MFDFYGINKSYIENYKRVSTMYEKHIDSLKDNQKALLAFLQNQNNKNAIIYGLERLKQLKSEYSKKPLLKLLNHHNVAIRILVIKNLAKMSDISLLDTFAHFAKKDQNTQVRRESVSAIGRLKDKKAIPILIQMLSDQDPKVVMQAMRGLFVFSKDIQVKKQLSKLLSHPNELIREVIHQKINGRDHLKNTNKQDQCLDCLKNTVVQGDVIEVLKYMPDESIHLTFTSPPYYNARDYSIYQSYEAYLKFLEEAFKAIHRVTKEGRFFILNTSPIIIPRMSRAHASKRYPIPYDLHPLLVKMGWEFIDDIVWVKPEASVKNRNAGFLQHRKPLGYKPNAISEMLMVYRKKTNQLIDWNMHQYNLERVNRSKVLDGYETTNVWHIDPTFDKVHSAVFPLELCNRIIKYYSFVEDLIFDPFAGSGTLGRSAVDLDRYFFLTEKDAKYINRIKENLKQNASLFSQNKLCTKFINIQDFKTLLQEKA